MSENRKIKNATPYSYKGINFKSKLEKNVYITLLEEGITPEYENTTFTLVEGFRPTVGFYMKTKSKKFHYEMSPIRDITYTPDFTFDLNGVKVIMEAKGVPNDVYPLKRKLFRKLLEDSPTHILFFEVKSIREVKEAIKIIKMESPLMKIIREGITKLPEKDISIANKYLENRDFDNLSDLVDSCIKRVKKNKEKYSSIELAYIIKLKEAITEYNEARSI